MSGKKIIQGLHEAIAHVKGADSLKERLAKPIWASSYAEAKQCEDERKEALARIEELEETYAATQLQIRLAYDKHDRDRATIAKLEADIDKEVYARVERWRSSVEAIQAKLDRATKALEMLARYFGKPVGVSLKELGKDSYIELPMKVRLGDVMEARSILSDTTGVPVAEPTVAGRKDEPSGESELMACRPQADAGEEPEGDLKAAREANSETIGRADDKRIKSLTGTISRQRETIGKLRRALVTCHAELVAEVQIHYEKLANPDPKYRYEASMGAILKARATLEDVGQERGKPERDYSEEPEYHRQFDDD